jgi:hypothetical protein
MKWLFATYYLIPAAVSTLAIWSIWRLVRLFELTLLKRRTLFVLLGTLLLTPVIVPAGIINVIWVPHSVVLLTPDVGYYVHFARFVFPSFALTATILLAFAWWRVKGDVHPLQFNWTTIAVPIVVATLIVGLFRYFVPDERISPKITTPVLDEMYGQHFEDVIALPNIEELAHQKSEVNRLQKEFRNHRAVILISLDDPRTRGSATGQLFYYLRDERPPSASCSGVSTGDQVGLSRCTWSYGTFNNLDVLQYKLKIDHDDEDLVLFIDFDYEELLDSIAY